MIENKQITIEDVINKQIENSNIDGKSLSNSELIMKAYNYANDNHGNQLRMSGEPYMIHPVNVAYILSELGLDD